MASTYSSNLKIELIANGEQAGTWGTTTNNNLGTLIEQAISGYTTLSFASGAQTLSMADGTSCDARNMYLELTGATATTTLTLPLNRKLYFVYNNSGYAITVKTAATTGVSVPNGAKYVLVCNGSEIINATNGNNVGTANVVARFTDQNTIGNSTIYDNGTNVGIGAISLTTRLALGGSSSLFSLVTPNILETATVSATPATGTINYDLTTQSVVYYTSNATANWTLNFRGSSGTTLDSILGTGQSITAVFMVTQGATAYYNSAVQIDGTTTGVTTKWQGGSAPTFGLVSSVNVYTYSIIKTASATYTVLASVVNFA